ncbi:MAG: peptidylprolyl isomerase [Gemmatimonadota bacterium]
MRQDWLLRIVLTSTVATAAACGAEADGRQVQVGEIGFPETPYLALAEAERQTLADLLAFASAVANDRTDSLLGPVVAREVARATVALLPVHVGARAMALDESELREVYAQEPEWELSVRHMVRLVDAADPMAERDRARAVAEDVAARAAAAADFATLAAEFSEEPGAAERGGLLQPGRRGSWVEPFWEAAVALGPGEVSGVVQTEYGYHVLRLDERRPVPFEEANRSAILARAVPPDLAADAMEAWAADDGRIFLDPPAVQRARDYVLGGAAVPDSLEIGRSAAGGLYRGRDLAAGWARLASEERQALEGADDLGFAAWIERDAREMLWARAGRDTGITPDPRVEAAAALDWGSQAATWAVAFGFRPGMTHAQIPDAARQALLSGAPEARSARRELQSLRPLLRADSPVTLPEPS